MKKSKHSPKKLLPKQSRLSARFSKQNKIKKPEIKLKTSRCIFQLADLLYDKYEELRRIEDSWEDLRCKMFRNPASKIYTKELDALTEKRSALLKELESMRIELDKEKFKAATGEDLDSVKRKAIGYGDKNSWLTLLRWDIEYLFDEQLIAIICKAHEDRTAYDIRFLGGIAHIIAHPLKPHGKVDMEIHKALLKHYDGKMTNKELQDLISEKEEILISDKYLRRIGLKK